MGELTLQTKYEMCLKLIEYLPMENSGIMNENTFPESKYIINLVLDEFKKTAASVDFLYSTQNDAKLKNLLKHDCMVEALIEKCWERIHTQKFNEVPRTIRQIYAMASLLKVIDNTLITIIVSLNTYISRLSWL